MRFLLATMIAGAVLAGPAAAQEAAFIEGLNGSWAGEGQARRTADGDPIGINCRMDSTANSNSFEFSGTCRALAVIRQNFSTSVQNTGSNGYQGTYTGPAGGRSALNGARSGSTIDFDVTWAEEVNGDDRARMQLVMPDSDTMIIRTIDTSPTTGGEVVTSEISMARQ